MGSGHALLSGCHCVGGCRVEECFARSTMEAEFCSVCASLSSWWYACNNKKKVNIVLCLRSLKRNSTSQHTFVKMKVQMKMWSLESWSCVAMLSHDEVTILLFSSFPLIAHVKKRPIHVTTGKLLSTEAPWPTLFDWKQLTSKKKKKKTRLFNTQSAHTHTYSFALIARFC